MPAKKKAAKKADTNEILIVGAFTTPDGTTDDFEIVIHNATGCIPRSRVNNSASIKADLVNALIGKYGRGHVRA